MPDKKPYGIFLTERTLISFLFGLLFGRKYCVLEVYSYLQNRSGYLQKVVNYFRQKGNIEIRSDRYDEFPYKDSGDLRRLTDVFSECELWMEKQFQMESIKGEFAQACKHVICARTYALFQRNYDLHVLHKKIISPSLAKEDVIFQDYKFKRKATKNIFEFFFRFFFNFLLLIISIFYTSVWILSRIRVNYKKEKINFAVDYNGGNLNKEFWDYINPEKEKTLVVIRDEITLMNNFKDFETYKFTFDNKGVLEIFNVPFFWLKSIFESIILFCKFCHWPVDYYRQIVFFPFKKIKYTAFFTRFKCSYFLGRDDYDPKHIIRNQELKKTGGISIGINHGIDSINKVAYMLRYLYFDQYYMHGIFQYNHIYKKYWPPKMKVKAVGSMMVRPKQYYEIIRVSGRGVAIIVAPSFHQNLIFEGVWRIVKEFPELNFFISTKWKHRSGGIFGQLYQDLINSGTSNVREYTGQIYDLIPKCKYIFSESSTLLAEAVYFNRIPLCYDPDPSFKFLYYRAFFGECISKTPIELIERIQQTMHSKVSFEGQKLDQLIHKDEDHSWAMIKEDLKF